MIRYAERALPPATQTRLDRLQQEINSIANYAEQVEAGKRRFENANTKRSRTFATVRRTLTGMCSGACRCMYCEDSCANQIDHFRPKDFYPEAVFDWQNYIHACGGCNVPKSNRFAVFAHATGQRVDITRSPGMLAAPPEPGDPLLINPRFEDPLAYLFLDLTGETFFHIPLLGLDSKAQLRAEYTIDVLGLNDREELVNARAEAYASYRARLREYIHFLQEDRPQVHLDRLRQAMQRMQHPTVWKEIQRQHTLLPDFKPLFAELPEALNW